MINEQKLCELQSYNTCSGRVDLDFNSDAIYLRCHPEGAAAAPQAAQQVLLVVAWGDRDACAREWLHPQPVPPSLGIVKVVSTGATVTWNLG